ncbi:MAG: hypothetical protein F6K31_33870 [Symploca sp. SIO2G7]|nr:hypothetical protein [Symploca sp. SIO2G7]
MIAERLRYAHQEGQKYKTFNVPVVLHGHNGFRKGSGLDEVAAGGTPRGAAYGEEDPQRIDEVCPVNLSGPEGTQGLL